MRVGGIAGLLMASLALSGCLQETETSSTGSLASKSAPGALRYGLNPVAYVVGEAAAPNLLSSTGTPDRVSITPALPSGLSFDTTTGAISGTPNSLSAARDYEVRATNAYGSAYLRLRLSVGNPAPVLSLSAPSVTGTVGSAITSLVATNSGGSIASCTTSPALPNGLSVTSAGGSCTISGTPSAVFTSATVTLTASSSARSMSTTFTLSIIDRAPAFGFSEAVAFPRNVAGYVASPTSTGGRITSCSANAALPAGVSLRSDCSFVGSPSSLASSTTYVLTGGNSGGTSTATVNLQIVDQTPSFYYTITNAAATLVKGNSMTTAIPVVTAGTIDSCTASPALPAGLTLSSTCTISGTPTAVQSETTHIISAENSAGTGTAALKFTVNDVPPRFSYTGALLVVENRGTAGFSAVHNGGTATGCSTRPSLPAGLSIATNCSITGSPTQASAIAEYSITATNSGGSFMRLVQISVPEIAPSISYSPSQVKATLGTSLTEVGAQNAGGAITSCAVVPALPGSLSLNSGCVLSGLPIELSSPAAAYTVTAENSVGSSTATITVEVVDREPQIRYPGPDRSLTINEELATWIPISTGGTITSCSDSPTLPAGLTLSATDCSISGTPTALSVEQSYTISATNTGGTATTTITLTVKDRAPVIQFMPGSLRFTLQQAVTPVESLNSGGDATECTSSPTMPDGLSVSVSSGKCSVSGTPTALSAKSGYTVTATNTGGSSSTLLEVEVVDAPPVISYSPDSQSLTRGTSMPSWTPTNTGGAITSCSSSHPLPQGLSVTQQCEISGTPTAISATQAFVITASNTGGSGTASITIIVNDQAPTDLVYSEREPTYVKGTAIAPNSPSNSGGVITSYSISPALPSGLLFNTTTGIISGNPAAIQIPAVVHTVTGSNTGGSTTATTTITVNEPNPTISYSGTPFTFTKGTAVSNVTATASNASAFSISGTLPGGLSFDASTGEITGTPTELLVATPFSVTVTNATGQSASTTINLRVIDVAPSNLVYSEPNATYTVSTAITDNTPTSSGGAVVSYSITPALPSGLSFDSTTGVISGTPTSSRKPPVAHTVVATNSGGSTSATVVIEINQPAPTLSYTGSPFTFTKGVLISSVTATATNAASFAITGRLPNGLAFSTASGAITGTPSELFTATEFEVTASNSTGQSATATISVAVNDAAPTNLVYFQPDPTYISGSSITPNNPSNAGGVITSYTIDPALPAGLLFNSSTGVISGTATTTQNPAVVHTITGSNSGGSTTVTMTLTVNSPAPTISYAGSPYTLTKGTGYTLSATSTNGTIFAIGGTLPNGLSLDASTGAISGTPTELLVATPYSVTVTNSTGQTASTTLNLTVNDIAPSALSYSTPSATYTVSTAIADNTPTISGGFVLSYSIIPNLPAGLSFNTTTGVISGTASATQNPAVVHTVTAVNSGGSTSANVTLTVNAGAPTLAYSDSSYTLTRGESITLSATTQNISSLSIGGRLPNGLSFSISTGEITGTPTELMVATPFVVTGTNSTGQTASATITLTVNDAAPAGLVYFDAAPTYTTGIRITDNTPSSSGGSVLSYSITPNLPAGLSFNAINGVISGTATATQNPAVVHTITATNSGGSTTGTINLTVNSPAPTISYSGRPFTLTKGTGYTLSATSTNGSTFAIGGTLPSGLSLDASTGSISGTPTDLLVATPYNVTVTNSTGQTASTTINLTVNDIAPSALSYSAPSATYTVSTAITDNTPTISGGIVLSYSINPSLPAGLNFNSATGVISGTATATQNPAVIHTITASNSGGSTSATVTLTVNAGAPTLSYAGNPFTFTKGTSVSNVTATASNISSFAISGRLPNGLSLSTSTGEITGTPTELMVATPFVVTGTNSTGQSATETLNITVKDTAPSGLTYFESNPTYTTGIRITDNTPSSSGGAVLSYSITPALPAGLSFNTVNGVISGTATATQNPAAVHTISASNSGGSTTGTVTLTVNAPAPTISYAGSPFTLDKGTGYTLSATSTNGSTFAIGGTLPNGLSLDASTGAISGSPTELLVTTPYSVTVTNSTGQTASTTINITVNDIAPSALSYSTPNATYTVSSAITDNSPSISGGTVLSYSINPTLPAGLSFNTTSGVLSGTPTATQNPEVIHTITASNSGGSTSATVTLTVNAGAPTLAYAASNFTLTKSESITLSATTQNVTSLSIAGRLPNGLSFNTSTGAISGTPTELMVATPFIVTGTNSTGQTASATITLTVNDAAPSNLSYFNASPTYITGTAITDNTPSSSGGAVLSYSITPALPAGLTFNTTNGVIAGTATSTQNPAVVHTITAFNSGGSTTATVTLTVNAPAPTIAYSGSPFTLTKGTGYTLSATTTQGTSFDIAGTLPTGLSFNNSTGAITGTPTELLVATPYSVTVTNSTGQTASTTINLTVNDIAPSALSYSAPSATYTVSTAITDNTPTISGGTVLSYSINPALPAGLSFNTTTGVISGTPTATQNPAVIHTIAATNSGGSTSAAVTITVNAGAPTLSYSGNPFTFTKGTSVSNVTATASNISSFAISGRLPNGLSFSTSTGEIAGTPTELMVATPFVVTGTNSTGQTATETLSITVNDGAPSSLTYFEASPTYTTGIRITDNTPSSSGGVVLSYSITPALPAGLSFNTVNGVISGTATTTQNPAAVHTITATNSGGSTTGTVTLTVNSPAPTLSYAGSPYNLTKGTGYTLSASGTNGSSFAIGGTLPNGLSLDASTGAISGTPTELLVATPYSVTVTNSTGQTASTTINLTVNDVAPSALSYSAPSATYTVSTAITDNTPTISGGTVLSYSINPALPAGLSFNNTTGVISGTPSATQNPAVVHTITASNSGGSTSASVTLTVNAGAPTLTYSASSFTLTKSESITLSATSQNVSSLSIAGRLPNGLSFNTSSGAISGAPTELMVATPFVITGTNSTGQTASATISLMVNDGAPSSLSYFESNPTYTTGIRITDNTPSSSGGSVTSYSISPALPAGLSFNTVNGVISGTATATQNPAVVHTITATNTGGSTTGTVTLTVNAPAPTISYAGSPYTLTKGTGYTLSATSSQGASFAIGGTLPNGLSFNISTGAITGTPTELPVATPYSVTVTNSTGQTASTILNLTVNDVAPSALSYSAPSATYTVSTAITDNTPNVSGGTVLSYSINPTLPAGLSFNTTTGVISGTPSATQNPAVIHTITATNSGGSTSAAVTLTVNAGAPTLSYSGNPFTFTKGTAVSNVTASASNISSFAINGRLPNGLSFSTSTGEITGTPTELMVATPFLVTGTNSTGQSAAVTLNITVNDAAPSSLSYFNASPTYTTGIRITDNTPSSAGGAVTSYSITPALPAGLSFNAINGVISGTATATQNPAVVHTITAINSGGSTTGTITLTVNSPAPTISYAGSPYTLTKGTGYTLSATSTNGSSFVIGGTLPNGLSLDASTGAISGTPTELLVSSPYSVTITNSTGQTASNTLNITVNDVTPSALSYSAPSATYTVSTAITDNTPTISGGTVLSYSINPTLPAGLSFNTTTGVISGTPSATQNPAVIHTITASNSGGSTSANVTLTVNAGAPTLAYSVSSITLTKSESVTVSATTQNVSSLSISGRLPNGLSFNTSTGAISGTPTELMVATPFVITGTNSTGQTATVTLNISVNDSAPSTLTYFDSNPTYTTGIRITDNTPTSSGGAVLSYSITPALPAGLSFNTVNGVISGTATATQNPAVVHTITASNSGGSTTGTVTLTVNSPAPTIAYSGSLHTLTKGTGYTLSASSTNGSSFSIGGTLPNGLSLNNSTGAITGTPSELLVATPYSVTVTNSTGQTASTTINLTVNDLAPSSLSYSTANATYTVGSGITNNTPTISGGAVVSYSINPALPAGLSFNTTTGVISGTPTATQNPAITHTITALNSGGSTSATITITVNAGAPTLSYSGNPFAFTKGTAVSSVTATASNISSFAISGRLPNGLSFSTSTGEITGTPTELMVATPFLITGTNSTGQTATVTLNVTVNDAAPSSLVYFNASPTYTAGAAITDNTPSNSGGAVTSYSILPALPAGLTFNTTNGVIAGTPTAPQNPAVIHTITALNSGGSTTATITLTVNSPPPTISYSGSPDSITKNTTVTLTPTTTNAASFSLSGTLPTGLALNTTTGVISGTPTALTVASTSTITAKNSTGQSATATLSVAIVDALPSLTYNGGPFYFIRDEAIATLTPVNSGGTVTSCSSSPALPSGLSLSSTCAITGTPNTLSASASYAIQATNSGGTATVYVSIAVTPGPEEVPNIFLNWISLSALNGSWNGTANSEGRVWKARIDGASRTLHSTLSLGWAAKDLVQAPRLAPNGSYWVAVSTRNLSGNLADADNPCSNIWKVSPDGSQWTALTTNSTAGMDSLDPAISPDSATIAFASRQSLTGGGNASPSFNLWTMTSTGTGDTALDSETVANRDSREPSFSPNGGTIVFASRKKVGNVTSASFNLWKYTLSTSTAANFSSNTSSGNDRRQPRYSNDGATIVYVSIRPLSGGGSSTASYNLWSSTASSLSETAITSTTASGQDVAAPEFSVSDRYIAFQGYRQISGATPSSTNIWVYDTVNATFTPITQDTNSGLDSQLMPGTTW